ncbi:MAG: SPOR domain-containing protein [Wenzhouxiangellaceae bacterium]|nr:SPOR domain-containing protein [Wenzhouxiangellaceae bacterium]
MTIRILCLMLVLGLFGCDRQGEQWEEVQQEDTIAAYEAFVESYPDSPKAERARNRIDALRAEQAWVDAQERDKMEAYREFLEAHPDAAAADEARARLQTLELEAAWQELAGSDDLDALKAFATEHAGSSEAELARERVSELEAQAEAEHRQRERERERQQKLEREREAQRQAEQGTHRVQLAVVRGQEAADSGVEQLQRRLGEVLGDVGLEAQQINGRYRLVTQPMSREQARQLCGALKQRGQDCLVRQR